MKKIALSSALLAGFLASTAVAGSTAPVMVGVGGAADFQAGFRSQKDAYKTNNLTQNQKNMALGGDAKVYVKAMGKADNGLTYGGVLQLNTTANNRGGSYSSNFDRTYLFVESMFGRVEMGGNKDVANTMKVDASSFAHGNGGASNSDFETYINAGTGADTYWVSGDLAGSKSMGKEEARKISYYSPRFSGVQFGLSYTPDTANNGMNEVGTNVAMSPRNFKDVLSAGLTYSQQMDQMKFDMSLTGVSGKSIHNAATDTAGKSHDLSGYALGVSMNYANVTFGGSYGSMNKKAFLVDLGANATAAANAKNVTYWTAGVAYEQGPVGASVTYLNSDYQRNKFTNVAFGVDYKLAPGMMPYAELSSFTYKSNDKSVKKNSGTAVVVGTSLTF